MWHRADSECVRLIAGLVWLNTRGKGVPEIAATHLADTQSGLDELQPRCRASKSIPAFIPYLQYREKPERAGAEIWSPTPDCQLLTTDGCQLMTCFLNVVIQREQKLAIRHLQLTDSSILLSPTNPSIGLKVCQKYAKFRAPNRNSNFTTTCQNFNQKIFAPPNPPGTFLGTQQDTPSCEQPAKAP